MAIDLLTSTTTSKYTGMTPTTAVYAANDVFTPPSGYSASRALLCDVTVIGAGGGGAGLTNYIAGAGGSAGQVVQLTGVPVTAPVSVTIGTGGSGGAAGSAGSAGGSSSFGSIVAKGGAGGLAGAVTTPAATSLMPASSAGSLGGGQALVLGIRGSGSGVQTSTDGVSGWTSQSLPAQVDAYSRGAYGNGIWVVAGPNGAVYSSSNAITWTTSTLPLTAALNLIYANGLFVAVGTYSSGSGFTTSTDGLTWSTVVSPTVGSSGTWYNIAYGNGVWVLTSSGATGTPVTVMSPDLVNWTASGIGSTRYLQHLAFGNGVFVTAERGSNLTTTFYSADGKGWGNSNVPSMTSGNVLNDLVYANGAFVLSSVNQAEWWRSTDGFTWTRSTATGPGSSYQYLSVANGLFFAGNNGTSYLTSSDGTSWTSRTAPIAFERAVGRSAASGATVAAASSLTTVSPSGGAGGNGKTNGDGGAGGAYQSPTAATGTTSAAATAGQVAGAGGGGGGLGSQGGAAGANGQVVVTYWQ